MVCWPTIIQCRKREPEGSIVSILHRAALTGSSAVSKADTVSHRGKIVLGERGRGKWRTKDIYWYGQVLQCSSRCPSVKVSCSLDINHYWQEAKEISTLASPIAFFPFFPRFKPTWLNPVCVYVHFFGFNVTKTDETIRSKVAVSHFEWLKCYCDQLWVFWLKDWVNSTIRIK